MPDQARDGTWEVGALAYARHRVPKRHMYLRWHTYGRPDADIELVYFVWFARSEGETVLIDTGFDTQWFVSRGDADLGWTAPPAVLLAEIGIDPAAVRTIVLTHLHFDHIGNLELFPNAQFVVQRSEWSFWTGPDAVNPPTRSTTDLRSLERLSEAERDGRLVLLDGETDVRPGVRAVPLPGHTPGQQGVLIDGRTLLASDAAHFYEVFEDDLLCAAYTDLPAMVAQYRSLRTWSANGVTIVPGHDAGVLDRFDPIDAQRPDRGVWLAR